MDSNKANSGNSPERFIGADLEGARLDKTVKQHFQLPWAKARAWIDTGKVFIDGNCVSDQAFAVAAGSRIELRMSQPKKRPEPKIPDAAIVYFDEHIVVVNKAAGLMTVPHPESDETETLDRLVNDYLRIRDPDAKTNRASLGVVHRIDKDTSGLVVFARTFLAKRALSEQFRAHSIERRYLAIVHGELKAQSIRTHLVRETGDGLRGSAPKGATNSEGEELGRLAITHVDVVERLAGATLVSCRIETGRTHQIRIHLSEIGHPIVGEKVYIRGFEGELIPANRAMLHAAELGFIHPGSGEAVSWQEEASKDFQRIYKSLRLKTY
ncbi:pseudouridine synthase, RluA family [Verrucomicrobiia bacterium DG1235]|nr:pseudouridine synthase, RluA family [Verrucomicrobiae bacterium DG1235]